MATKILLHEMGEGVVEGTVSRWLKQPGDAVAKYEPVLEIETDKVTTEVTAEAEGILLEALVPEGTTVPVGTVLAIIGKPGEDATAPAPVMETAVTAVTPQTAAPITRPAPPADHAANGHAHSHVGRISPVVGRIAAEHDIDLSQVMGTGRGGRITKKDVLAFIEEVSNEQLAMSKKEPAISPAPLPPRSPAPLPPAPQPAAGDTLLPLTNMRRAIAEHMVRSKHTSPHVTTVFEFDFTAVAAHRAAHKARFAQDGANLTFTAYIVAATVEALKQHSLVNSAWSDDGVILKKEINIGMAAAIEEGLIVPVIKNADSLNTNLFSLASSIFSFSIFGRSNSGLEIPSSLNISLSFTADSSSFRSSSLKEIISNSSPFGLFFGGSSSG